MKELEGAIEAILFAMGESVELSRIAKAIRYGHQRQRRSSFTI